MEKERQVSEWLNRLEASDKITPGPAVWETISRRINQPDPDRKCRDAGTTATTVLRRAIILTTAAALLLLAFGVYTAIKLVGSLNRHSEAEIAATVARIESGVLTEDHTPLNAATKIRLNQDIIASAETRAELQPAFGIIKLVGTNHLRFLNKTTIELDQGEIMVEINIPQPDGVVIKTPNARARATGTKFLVKASGDLTVLKVTEGTVVLSNNAGMVEVKAGFQSIARGKETPLPSLPEAVLPLTQLSGDQKLTPPRLQIEPLKNVYRPDENLTVKFKIINTDEQDWFFPPESDNSYLLLHVTNPHGKVFYVRVYIAVNRPVTLPAGMRQENGWITFNKDAAYELFCVADKIPNEPGTYLLKGVYGAVSTKMPVTGTTRKVWQGLVESEPVPVEVRP